MVDRVDDGDDGNDNEFVSSPLDNIKEEWTRMVNNNVMIVNDDGDDTLRRNSDIEEWWCDEPLNKYIFYNVEFEESVHYYLISGF